ncbi:MAG TPA: sigma 54-interacting transcriptional regulator [Candidatus Acidoferrales bacterium]|nr:sigma 54-interacting transcriptional regulator [Candidatus Acidoferrales bacterium]
MAQRQAATIPADERHPVPMSATPLYLESACPAMHAIEKAMRDIAATEIPVLLIGESGTGKDAAAMHLHRHSQRRAHPFRKILGSSAMPEQLSLEALGQEFGTVYLDEVADFSAAAQTRLLQSLAERDVPGNDTAPRLISGTTRNLEEWMRSGRFREQLYFRLNGVCLRLPPLRHRKEDIPGLAGYFLARYAALFGRPKPALSAPQMRVLQEYAWPGNIRELENAMKKAVVVGGEVFQIIEIGATPEPAHRPATDAPTLSLKDAARAASRQAERELILKALARTRWNRKRAAMELRISYKALLYKLKQIGPEEATGD